MRFIIDDRKVDRNTASMQVLSLGLSRCATSSLQAALESDTLGYAPCMHMAHIAPHADREQLILDALAEPIAQKRQKILHRVFDGYASTCDFPGWSFASDLMDMYPDAVIILNSRNSAAAWLKSIRTTVAWFGTRQYYLVTLPWKTDRLHYRIHQNLRGWVRDQMGLPEMDSEEFYEAFYQKIRNEAAKRNRKVLEWQATDGWGPLCKFLERKEPVDDRAFPHLNDARQIAMLKKILVARGLLGWVGIIGAGLASWRFGPRLLQKTLSFISQIN